jgi:hypothetical protein
MKTKMKIIALFLVILTVSWMSPYRSFAQSPSVSFQVFYDELSPYGTWVDNPEYGYVWVPDVAPGFSPYATNGYWVFTNEGWTWVSSYSWGWAPFHYGRWFTDPVYGPIWVPDNEWGPGWVTWRRSNGYYGWAPIGPGVSITVAYGNGYNVPYNEWRFVRDRDFGRRNINNYYVGTTNNTTIINNSVVINNTYVDRSRNVTYNTGPERAEVEKRAGRKFAPVAIKESNKPGQVLNQNQLQIYRPKVQRSVSEGQKPAPIKVESLKNVKPAAQRISRSPSPKENQPLQQERKVQPIKQEQLEQPRKDIQPAKQQQRNVQPAKQQQPPQQQKNVQPAKQQQPPQQQKDVQPAKKQQAPQQQRNVQPAKQQQPPQQQRNVQPSKQQQTPSNQRNTKPARQQKPVQSQKKLKPDNQQKPQPEENKPPKKADKEQNLQQTMPL